MKAQDPEHGSEHTRPDGHHPGCVTVREPAAARGGPISHAIFRLARIHRMMAGQLLRRLGLHAGQELLMMQLWDAGPQRQADLVAILDSDSATITRTIQRLERAGFVRRTPSTADRRATIIEPTAASQALRREVEAVWQHLEELTAGDLTDDARETALRLLHTMEANLASRTADHQEC